MVKFREFIKEATLQDLKNKGFHDPSRRAKFAKNDIVLVINDGRWEMYQPSRSAKYISQYGKVVGYKSSPGSFVKYAVQFPQNNDIETFHSHFLLGPLQDEATAQKYVERAFNPNLRTPFNYIPKIQVSHLKKDTNYNMESNPKLEGEIKNMVTAAPFHFTWHETPLFFHPNNYIITVLASRPMTDIREEDIPFLPEFFNDQEYKNFFLKNYCVFRINNQRTGKLVKRTSSQSTGKFSGTSAYILWDETSQLEFFKKYGYDLNSPQKLLKVIQNKGIIAMRQIGLPQNLSKYAPLFIQRKLLTVGLKTGDYDPAELFEVMYQAREENGKKVINGPVYANYKNIDMFTDYEIHDPYKFNNVYLQDDNFNQIKSIPLGMKKIKITGNNNYTIDNLSAFKNSKVMYLTLHNLNINSLEGLPTTIKYLEIVECYVNKISTLPPLDMLTIVSSRINDPSGLTELPIASGFSYSKNDTPFRPEWLPEVKSGQYFIDGIDQSQIKKLLSHRKHIKSLDKETRRSWEGLLSEL